MNMLCVQEAHRYYAQGLYLSGWQTSVLDVCKHVSTQSVNNNISNFSVLLTVYHSITLVNDLLDTQLFYFIVRLLQSSTCFEQRRVHHQEIKLY